MRARYHAIGWLALTAFAVLSLGCQLSDAAESKADATLSVAAVQMRSSRDLSNNVARIKDFIRQSAAKGARVVVFPECALTGYFEDVVTNVTATTLAEAEVGVADACREAGVYAVLGTPYPEQEKLFNSAVIINPSGRVIARYHKIQLAERWPQAGEQLILFKIDEVPCSIIICHDERYPELVRLPVLAGAKVIFYVSHESGLNEERKINPYRAQIQTRAVENNVYIVQANTPANTDKTGSHGHSRIIAPDGNILKEASIFDEEIVEATLNLNRATRENATKSLTRGPLRDWWRQGLKRVKIVEDADRPRESQ
jgi:predicted amidohydrolase